MKPRHAFLKRHTSRSAFTLIELLVVVSIITLLIAISLPSLAKTRQRAAGAVCLTRIKGLTLALYTYVSEWNDTMPVNGVILPKSKIPTMYNISQTPECDPRFAQAEAPYNDQWRVEFGALWSYMSGPPLPVGYSRATANTHPLPLSSGVVAKAFICPDDSLSRTYQGTGAENQPLWLDSSSGVPLVQQRAGGGAPGYFSYSVNSVCNSLGRFRNRFAANELPWNDPLRMGSVKSPSNFVTFIEEDNTSLFNDEVFDAPAYNNGDMLANRHLGKGNVGFGDGHAESFEASIFNNPPSAVSGDYVQHRDAMTSEITRKFFPDGGAFANSY